MPWKNNNRPDQEKVGTYSPIEWETFRHVGNDPTKEGYIAVGDIISNSLVPSSYDYISVTYPTTSSEVYIFKTGGSGGTTVSTVTVVYTDATKASLSSVTKS